ncbi:GntR family transcriptional regulator [Cohnella fermenti]|uniref:GntR family transcriptional regulator n=1 Tax=Cohnella fermenti TaxID=2565925 RepID=A0A4S4C519_9BACL|nr:GntR family transcriptional regulator [Cohnella fermenti]THF82682.1 GntR family transcriptional regulator [Cohnella fermenti]
MELPKYQSLKDHVYNYIVSKIQDGAWSPNQKINEAEICKTLDISRTPTREALFQLTNDNLLEYIPRRGFIVKPFHPKEKLDVSQIIGALDALAASLAIEHIGEHELSRMQSIVDKINDDINRRDFAEYYQDQYDFHEIYTLKCNNPTLIEKIHQLKNGFIRQSYISEDKEKMAHVLLEVNAEHQQVIECFMNKDKDRLDCLLKFHWRIIDSEML